MFKEIASPIFGFYGNLLNAGMQQEENRIAREWAQANIDETRRREDNAIQRQVADLKLAGINPLMASGLGGAQASASASPVMGNIGADFSSMGDLWLQSILGSKQGQKIDAEIENLASQNELNIQNIVNLKAEEQLTLAKTDAERQAITESQQRIQESLQNIQLTIARTANEKTMKELNQATKDLTLNQIQEGIAKINYLQEQAKTQTVTRAMLSAQIKDLQGEKVRRWVKDIWDGINNSVQAGAKVIDSIVPF